MHLEMGQICQSMMYENFIQTQSLFQQIISFIMITNCKHSFQNKDQIYATLKIYTQNRNFQKWKTLCASQPVSFYSGIPKFLLSSLSNNRVGLLLIQTDHFTSQIDIQMIQQHLSSMWTFWSCYSMSYKDRGSHHSDDYDKNLIKVLQFSTLNELSFVLEKSKYGSLDNFFTNLANKQILKFETEEKNVFKQIDAISLFRDDIKPTWQYGDNSKGGMFIAAISRDGNLNTNDIYRSLVIALTGDIFPNPAEIIGARFVDKSNFSKGQFFIKVEVWVSYNNDDKKKIEDFTKSFGAFANQVYWPVEQIEFRNNAKW